eukprot:CAMPEP_0119038432 /NCGR_PEP_ID=MMETSP1177-20130426/7376_1 /TAXON_ID=2985 /ORGANISM="Ochromonas sp, Strain CCMP1899" /LENGTH=63 /DNA_ID=CAMNT_0007001033 /DNA_START=740 /DNA_END=931 /DNA_ORIENTATION=+
MGLSLRGKKKFGMQRNHSLQSILSIENERINAAMATVDGANNMDEDSSQNSAIKESAIFIIVV